MIIEKMKKKVCKKCGVEKLLCEYHIQKSSPDGYKYECKKCRSIQSIKYRKNNIIKINKQNSNYYQKNKEDILIKKREKYAENPSKYLENGKKYRENNNEKHRERGKKYRENNKDKVNKRHKKYNETHKTQRLEYVKNRYKTDILFRLKCVVKARVFDFLKRKEITKKNKTFDIVGCSPEELKEHLEKQFTDGMCWDNQGKWHIDHIIPLSSAKTKEEIYKLCRYTNLQPLWAEDNLKKSNKLL